MDIQLGNSDGIVAATEISQRFSIPVVFVTGNSDERTLARANASEPFGWVCKPINHRSLVTAIDIALARSRSYDASRLEALWFKSQLASLQDGVICTDYRGIVRYVNAAAKQLLNVQHEIVGAPFRTAFDLRFAATGAPTGDLVRLAMLHGGSLHLEAPLLLTGASQNTFDAEVTVTKIQSEVIGTVLTFRSTNDRRLRRSNPAASLFKSSGYECARTKTSVHECVAISVKDLSPTLLPHIAVEVRSLKDVDPICANRSLAVDLLKNVLSAAARRISKGKITILLGHDPSEADSSWVRIVSEGTRCGTVLRYSAVLDGTLLMDSQLARAYAAAESINSHIRHELGKSFESWTIHFSPYSPDTNSFDANPLIIVLVEEDDFIRTQMCDRLASSAYECFGARTMDEAIELNLLYQHQARVLLCPATQFSAAARALRESDPLLKVGIFGSPDCSTSGFDLALDATASLETVGSAIRTLHARLHHSALVLGSGATSFDTV